jgi:hypothetical protein
VIWFERPDAVAGLERAGTADQLAVHEGAVLAPQVPHEEAAAFRVHLGVSARGVVGAQPGRTPCRGDRHARLGRHLDGRERRAEQKCGPIGHRLRVGRAARALEPRG